MLTTQVQTAAGIRWKLEDVLPSPTGKLFQSTVVERLEGMLVEFERKRIDLNEQISVDRFLQVVDEYEKITALRSSLGSYAYMYFSEDTRSQEARTFKARSEEIEADASNRILFFDLWWKGLNEKKTEELLTVSGKYSYFLKRLTQTKQYTLSEPVEQAINLKDVNGRSALLQIYHQIRDSFSYEVKIGDRTEILAEEQVRDLFYSQERVARESAYESMLEKFMRNRDVLGEIYKALARDWRNDGIKLRKYSSPISIRNVSNDVPDEAVNALLEVCKRNAVLFQKYFKLKSKILGISEFSRTDVYAPLPSESEKKYSWADGMKLVLDTFSSFDEDFAAMAKNVFSASHFDAELREGKLGGAYCMSVTPRIIPYILLSYTGTPRSVSTLAHELGHAVHSQLSSRRGNNQLTYEAPLPLAETASVFGELLLTDRLLTEADELTRRSILVEMVNEAYSTLMRQAFFVLFEREAHSKIASGINVDELCKTYLSNLDTQFGDSLNIPEYFGYEWLSIPHIYQTPFYCYAYSWGNLLVLALYRQYREEGKSFVPRYLKLLSYGGSEAPEKILSEAGFDVRSEKFWQSGFDELDRSILELEKVA